MSAHTLISSTTISSTTGLVTINSIPSTYRDLILVCHLYGTSTAGLNMWVNNDQNFMYDYLLMSGNGSSATTSANNLTAWPVGQIQSTQQNNVIINFLDYAVANKQRYVFWKNDIPNTWTRLAGGRYTSTNAITRIDFQSNNNIDSGSTFNLYGVSA